LAQLGAISCKKMQLTAIFGGREEMNLQKQTKETKKGCAGAAVTPKLPGTRRQARNRMAISLFTLFTFFTLAGIRRRGCNTQLYIVRMVRNAVLPFGGDFFEISFERRRAMHPKAGPGLRAGSVSPL
jgi:hypothetical protein